MRIAILCPYSLSKPGGVQGQVLGLAGALNDEGHDAVVIAPSDGPVSASVLREVAIVPVGRSLPVPSNGSMAPVTLSPLSMLRAAREVRRGRYDVLNIHEPLAPGPGYGCLIACGQPKVGTFHRSGTDLLYRALGPLARLAAQRLDVRCAVSPEAKATAESVAGGTYEVVGNGVDVDRFSAAAAWPTSRPTVIFVGRHEPRKGLASLLEAWETLERDGPGGPGEAGAGGAAGEPDVSDVPSAVLWVVGEGPQTEELRRRHPPGPRLEWLGRVGDDELAARIAGAHLLCAPSLGGESFGVVLLEAMAAGTAVIASDLPGYAFAAGGHATLVAKDDRRALVEALRKGIYDAAAGTGICAPHHLDAAVEHARTWSMQALARRYLGIFEALVH